MTKQIEDIVQSFLTMSVQEREAVVEKCRYNKYVLKPSHQAKKKKASGARKKTVANKLKALASSISDEDLKALLRAAGKL